MITEGNSMETYQESPTRTKVSVGESVRIIRELQELSQNELSALTGIPQLTLSAIEHGNIDLGVERAKVLARALKVHPADLVFPSWDIEQNKAAITKKSSGCKMQKDELFTFIKAPNAPVSEKDILDDLKRVSSELDLEKLTIRLYAENGQYDVTTVIRKFGSWNKSLEIVGLKTSNVWNIPDEELFANILSLWEHFGRQPRRADLTNSPSKCSKSPYNRRFSTWTNALENFVIWANGEELIVPDSNELNQTHRKTGRDPSVKLRFRVMRRDNFTCKQCGASPAKSQNVELHIDHIMAWSKGGDTTFNNLQTLCSKCNLGKSNL